ncbi:methyltransferase domain-containing protein [Ancylobacter sp. MQZ15Z-1]|uniref:Methyltransferase domain-containing protein n=1 Tax=Ancylobacter mangrovi TaxID=2972472 RepID=A0A9X2PCK3_9HYPH|nr:class I SAM-dependent methyltransferase [Ancylobacter mangrovi]MCS0494959.1 methyltransferase domain-containing protein [Ancylobacter mangrovi]
MNVISPQTIPFEPARFRSTAEFYSRYRVPYPESLIADVAQRIDLRPGDRVLDLGCGPGPLAIAFARLGARVTAMDPEPSMLDAARADASWAGVELTLVQGSSYGLDNPVFGRFRAVVMGRSFHWMDRQATLATLDRMVDPDGAVVLFGDRQIFAMPDWRPVLELTTERHAGPRLEDRNRRRSTEYVPHEAVLLASPFHRLERMGRVMERRIDIEDVIGRAFSRSVTSPATLGMEREAFELELRAGLAALAPDGVLTEVIESQALIALRDRQSPIALRDTP